MSLITFISKVPGVYYCQARRSGSFGLTGYANAYHGWRERIVFAASPSGVWDIDTVVGLPDSNRFKDWGISKRIQELYKEIGSPYFQLDVCTLEYDIVKPSKRKAREEQEASAGETVEVRKKMKNEGVGPSTAVAPVSGEEASASTGNSDSGDDTAGSTGEEEESEEERAEESSGEEGSSDTASESAASGGVPIDADQAAPTRATRVSPRTAVPPKGQKGLSVKRRILATPPETIAVSDSTPEGGGERAVADVPEGSERPGPAGVPEQTARLGSAGVPDAPFWWNNEGRVLTLRYNSDYRYFPSASSYSDVPSAVLKSMTIASDVEELRSMPEADLPHLQATLAFKSAMVGRVIHWRSQERAQSNADLEEAAEHFSAERADLLAKVAKLEAEVTSVTDDATKARDNLLAQNEKLSTLCKSSAEQMTTQVAENLQLKKERKEMEEKFAAERLAWETERQGLLKQVEDAKVEKAAAVTEALEAFKSSEEFSLATSLSSRDCFDTFKDVLVVDGWVERSVVEKYDYETCMERDASGEFDNLPK